MAPKDRVRPEELTYSRQGDTTILRPQANPVDTYVRPAEPIKSSLHDVATSLAQVQPRLDRFVSERAYEQAQEDAREAEAKGMIATAKSWDEAIQKGEVSAGASPLYKRVFEETLGKLSGLNDAQAKLWQEWVAPDNAVRTTQDPEVIAKWFQERRAKFLEGKSSDWVKGFSPALAQVQQQLTQKIISDNVKYIEQQNHDALGQLFMERISAGIAKGQSPGAIAAQLADDALPQRFAGMQGRDINQVMAKAILAVAQKTGRTDILQIGYADRPDLKRPGGTIKGVFTIPEFAMAADSAATSILSKANAAETRAQLAEARAEKRVAKDMLGEMITKRAEDPTWEPDTDWKVRAARAGLTPAVLRSQLDATIRPPKSYDPVVFNSIAEKYVDVLRSGGDATQAIQAMAPYMTASQLLQLHKENDKGADSLFRSRVYGIQDDALKSMVDRLNKNLDPIGAANIVRQARTELAQFALEEQRRMSAGGTVDPAKLEQLIVNKTNELAERMRQADEGNAPPSQPTGKPGQKQSSATPAAPSTTSAAPAAAPKATGSTAAAIPTDRLIPVPATQSAHTFPGTADGSEWKPLTLEGLDFKTINYLRADPMRDVGGRPLWQAVDERYGQGASKKLLSATTGEINWILKKSQFHNKQTAPFTTTLEEVGDELTRNRSPNK
jgi:hypothetical protein